MTRLLLSLAAAALMLPALLAPSSAAAEEYTLDGAHSTVGFKVRHLGVSWVKGEFQDFSGKVVWDPASPGEMSVDVSVKVKSIDTDNKMRDDHLRSDDFFNAKAFPVMTFKSKSSSKVDGGIDVVGDLTIRDVTKEVVLHVTDPTDEVKDPFTPAMKRGASGTAKVLDRKEFGLKYGALTEAGGLIVGSEIHIEIEAELTR